MNPKEKEKIMSKALRIVTWEFLGGKVATTEVEKAISLAIDETEKILTSGKYVVKLVEQGKEIGRREWEEISKLAEKVEGTLPFTSDQMNDVRDGKEIINRELEETLDEQFPKGDKARGKALVLFAKAQIEIDKATQKCDCCNNRTNEGKFPLCFPCHTHKIWETEKKAKQETINETQSEIDKTHKASFSYAEIVRVLAKVSNEVK